MRRLGVLLLLGALVAGAGHATTFYWGPVKGRIANNAVAGAPTIIHTQQIYFQLDQGLLTGDCLLMVDTYGISIGDPYVRAGGNLVFNAFINSYAGPDRWQPSQSLTCFNLLSEGKCLLLDGHTTTAPDLTGSRWIVDHISAATCP